MNKYKNLVASLISLSVSALFCILFEERKNKQSAQTAGLSSENFSAVNDLQIDNSTIYSAKSSLDSNGKLNIDFEPITSRDIAMGFYIIREWEFSKYHFNEREREIARMLLDGLSNKQIAMRACLAESSVKYHISSIFKKTSLTNRNDFGTLIKKGMSASTRQWSSRSEMAKELELLNGQHTK